MRLIAILAEAAADDQHSIGRLDHHGVHVAIRAVAEVDRRIRRAARQQTGDVIAGDIVGQRELADEHNAIVRLQRNALNGITGARHKIRIARSINIQTHDMAQGRAIKVGETAASQHTPVRLDGNRTHGVIGAEAEAGIKIRVRRTIQVETRQPVQGSAIEVRERAADQNLARINGIGRINGNGINRTIRTGADRKGTIGGAVIVQARETRAGRTADDAKRAANVNFADAADKGFRQRIDNIVCAKTGVETCIQRAIGHQPGNELAIHGVDRSEGATHQNMVVSLTHDCEHRTVRADQAAKEGGVQRAVGVQPGQAAFTHRADRREIAAGQNLAVGLQRQSKHVSIYAGGIEACVR